MHCTRCEIPLAAAPAGRAVSHISHFRARDGFSAVQAMQFHTADANALGSDGLADAAAANSLRQNVCGEGAQTDQPTDVMLRS
jgi:hypothetical protein